MQNTNEILSRYLLYAAGGNEAAEKKACMKPKHCVAAENRPVLETVYKRLEAEKAREYEATSEEATERRTQQQCSLSGGVYLRHRLEK